MGKALLIELFSFILRALGFPLGFAPIQCWGLW